MSNDTIELNWIKIITSRNSVSLRHVIYFRVHEKVYT